MCLRVLSFLSSFAGVRCARDLLRGPLAAVRNAPMSDQLNSHNTGESHCKGVGCIIDGVPPRMKLTEEDLQAQLTRRRPGQSHLTTPRNEKDRVTIYSGTEVCIVSLKPTYSCVHVLYVCMYVCM